MPKMRGAIYSRSIRNGDVSAMQGNPEFVPALQHHSFLGHTPVSVHRFNHCRYQERMGLFLKTGVAVVIRKQSNGFLAFSD
jgi:hypothetical protein